MKYLHIMPDSVHSKAYSDRVNKLFDKKEHVFLIRSDNSSIEYDKENCVIMKKNTILFSLKLIKWIFSCKRVVLHSLFIDKKMHVILAFLSCFMRDKFIWYIWSGDLYAEHYAEEQIKGISLKKRMKFLMRKIIIANLKAIGVCVERDYVYAKKWYKTKAVMLQADYAHRLVDILSNDEERSKESIYVLAGHSASERVEHEEMFGRIAFCKEKNVKVISVLSYPDNKAYVSKILELGNKMFNEKFDPILKWMPYEDYIALLNSIDIALFEGDVQLGGGNILNLVYLGKKVYLSKDNGFYQKLKKEGVICFAKEELHEKEFFELISEEEKRNNKEKIEHILSEEVFKEKWNKFFV